MFKGVSGDEVRNSVKEEQCYKNKHHSDNYKINCLNAIASFYSKGIQTIHIIY